MNEKTIKDIGTFLTRFGPYLCLVAAVAAVMVFLPGDDDGASVAAGNQFGEFQADEGDTGATSDFGAGDTGGQDTTGADTGGGSDAIDTSSGNSSGGATVTTSGGTQNVEQSGDTTQSQAGTTQSPGTTAPQGDPATANGMVANCDPNTGRIKIPSHRAPPCMPAFSGDNGGATYQGVTADTVKVAVYLAESDPASSAILAAAGAEDSREDVIQQHKEFADFYGTHYETWGREIELVFIEGSGPATDDAVGRADAKRVISEGVFASINAPNNVYVDELVANGIMCFCTTSLPNSFYTERAPFVFSGTLMSSSQGYFHRAEFIGKRLAGRPAEHAGDPLMATQDRVFGLAYYDDDQQSYRPGIDFFIQELRNKYGVELAAIVAYKGFPDTAASQEAARPLIQKMKSAGVTSLIFSGDPFAPIFFTQEATRQQYLPEWIITGSALTDTSFFARLYDQQQWANAFGVSFLSARVPEEKSDLYHKLFWHHGHEPPADGTYAVINAPVSIFWQGIHVTGPNLNPGTFRDAMFTAPPTGIDKISLPHSSYGQGLWPFDDYTSYDDITMIWWDPAAQGQDELGNPGVGLYRYVDMGKRYLPGEQPNSNTKAFQPENTITVYEDYPPGDAPPDYPPPR